MKTPLLSLCCSAMKFMNLEYHSGIISANIIFLIAIIIFIL